MGRSRRRRLIFCGQHHSKERKKEGLGCLVAVAVATHCFLLRKVFHLGRKKSHSLSEGPDPEQSRAEQRRDSPTDYFFFSPSPDRLLGWLWKK